MSIRGFQRAMADMVSSPELCRETLEKPSGVGTRYDLTELERRRLLHCIGHRGMKVCWGLQRANRLGPIHAIFPLTCVALGSHLRNELELFWRDALPRDLQFQREGDRFAAFLLRRVRSGELEAPVLEDVVPFEVAVAELRFQSRRAIREALARAESAPDAILVLHPFVRLIPFNHEPERLLEMLGQDQPTPPNLARGQFFVLVDHKDQALAIRVLDTRLGLILNSLNPGSPLSDADRESLLQAGLIARWPRDLPAARSPMQLV
jgi:hypothetical protein